MTTADDLRKLVIERYGSLDEPSFHWVGPEYDRDSFGSLRSRLETTFAVEDITDLNSDVSFGYWLDARFAAHPRLTLRLSLVGPYAVLLRHKGPPPEVVVDGEDDCRPGPEAFVCSQLAEHGIEILDREQISSPVPLALFETEIGRVRMYQALFVDTDFLPGEEFQRRRSFEATTRSNDYCGRAPRSRGLASLFRKPRSCLSRFKSALRVLFV